MFNNYFIGREDELSILLKRCQNSHKELVAITGKRGVGKTELMKKVKELLKSPHYSDDYVVIEIFGQKNSPLKRQLKKACDIFTSFFNKTIEPSDWGDFFDLLQEEITLPYNINKKFILLIDEFPWLNTKGSNFIDDFGTFWNRNNYENFKIVLTGSAVSWINQNVFRSKGGLCHKTTLKIKLKSFSMQETMEYLLKENSNFTNSELVEYYLMTGGVVRYLQNIHSNRTIEENYNSIYKNNYFDDFFDNTFNSVKTNIHKKIISMFSNRIKIKIEDIEKEIINVSHQLIYNTIKELVETDLLIEIKDNGSKKNKSYILSDL